MRKNRFIMALLTVPLILIFTGVLWGESAISLYERGKNAQLIGNLDKAIELYRNALIINPNYYEPMKGLARCFFLLNEYEEALKYASEAEKYNSKDLELWNLKGRIMIGLGKLDDARQLFMKVLAVAPNDQNARYGLAELDLAEGKKRSAALKYIRTLHSSPQNARALLSLALIYKDLGENDSARRYLELALRYHSGEPKVHLIAAQYLMEDGKYDDALQHVNVALSLKPEYRDALIVKSELEILKEKYDRSVQTATKLINIDRDDSLAWYLLGISMERKGDYRGAANSFYAALRIKPDDEISRITLENMAVRHFDQKDELRNQLSVYHYKQGKVFESKNYLTFALREYRRSLLLNPEFVQGRIAFASIFKLSGYPIKYLKELEIVKKIDPENTFVKDEIDNYTYIKEDSMASSWGIDQYELERKKFNFGVYIVRGEPKHSTNGHSFFDRDFLEYFNRGIEKYDNIEIKDTGIVNSFNGAFKRARENKTDYFLRIEYTEGERDFYVDTTVFLSKTGTKLTKLDEYRTGNDRVRDSVMNLSEKLHGLLPLRGILLKKVFGTGVIDIGRMDGVKKDDNLLIVKKNHVALNGYSVGFKYNEENVLGSFLVQKVDERVSEGVINKKSFFDLINNGDIVIYKPKEKKQEKKTEKKDKNLLQKVFGL